MIHKSVVLQEGILAPLLGPGANAKPGFLKEDSPATKRFKAKESAGKLTKGRTFVDEEETLQIENKTLKFKLERQSKELQELKSQLRANQEMSAVLRSTVIEERQSQEEVGAESVMNELLNNNYYLVYLQKLKESVTIENNLLALIQNQGVLLRTRSIEVAFRNTLARSETGGLQLRYELLVRNLEEKMLENLWFVYKQAGNRPLRPIKPPCSFRAGEQRVPGDLLPEHGSGPDHHAGGDARTQDRVPIAPRA